MDQTHNASLAYALDLWADWMRNDFAEVRALWYPAKSMVLEPRQSVTESSDIEHEDNIEHRIVIEVNNAMINLTPGQRAAIERSLQLTAIISIRNYEEQLEIAQDIIWRHILAMGCI